MSADDVAISPYLVHIYEQYYLEMNPNGLSEVFAVDAANYLRGSGLPSNLLGQIWELADYAKRGALDKKGAFIAFKLIAAAQQGYPIGVAALSQQGLNAPVIGSRTTTPAVGTDSIQASPTRAGVAGTGPPHSPSAGAIASELHNVWAIQPVDQVKYDSIFDSLGPENDKLPGSKVRPVLLNSGLAPALLAKIWELSDQDKDGQLDRIEMAVALHLVYRALQTESVPSVLPQSLIHPSKASLCRRTSVASQHSIVDHAVGAHAIASRNRTSSLASLEGASFASNMPGTPVADFQQRSYSVQPSAYARHGSLSGTPLPYGSTTSLEWPVDLSETAAIFARCDTNNDGLVSGADVKDELMRTGIPPPLLGKIWALADFNNRGLLNAEQFALIMHLIGMVRSGQELPSTLPVQLLPPSTRQLGLQNGISTNDSNGMTSTALNLESIAQSNNPEIKELAEDMERLTVEKRDAEEKITQLEADMTVKNSEIRNLQIELTTLENTVKALERQKGEAGKRLTDLDNQITLLEEQCKIQIDKVEEGQTRLETLKGETEQGAANAQKNAETLAASRNEMAQLESESRTLCGVLQNEHRDMENTVEELTRLEREETRMSTEMRSLAEERAKIETMSEKLKGLIESPNPEESLFAASDVFSRFKTLDMFNEAPFSTQSTSSSHQLTNGGDPFAGRDPFAGAAASSGPTFGGFNASFPSDPFGQPVNGGSTAVHSEGGSTAPARPVPPRPAPPRPSPTPATVTTLPPASSTPSVPSDPFAGTDPFGAANAPSGSTGGFADFANFGAFT